MARTGVRASVEMRRFRLLGGVLLVTTLACGGEATLPPTTLSPEAARARIIAELEELEGVPQPMRGSILSWFYGHGLAQLDPAVWQARLDRACQERFWEAPVRVEALADEFVAADFPLSYRRNEIGDFERLQIYATLWQMALNHCRELVPEEVARAGPPHHE